jgi:hypothetical protein
MVGHSSDELGYSPTLDVDGSALLDQLDLDFVASMDGTVIPTGAPIGTTNDAPSARAGGSVNITDDEVDAVFSWWDDFQDADTPDSQLDFEVKAVSDPTLFDDISIDTSTGLLRVSAASGSSGHGDITIQAKDSTGQTVLTTYYVDIDGSNYRPQLEFAVLPMGSDTYRIVGQVTDDDPVKGLIVQFYGAVDKRASVWADGTFQFVVIAHQEDWGDAMAIVTDRYGATSIPFTNYIGMT